LKILFAASEAVPYCKTGGLADVSGALPSALASKRHSVAVCLPLYRVIRERFKNIRFTGRTVHVPFGGKMEPAQIWEARPRPGLRIYFVDAPPLFDRAGLYGPTPADAYSDNHHRYAFFSRAVLAVAKAMAFQPDVIHGHDWQTGPLMAYLSLSRDQDSFFENTASVFSIHNMAYQGSFPGTVFPTLGLPPQAFTPAFAEFYGQVNFLKMGLVYADALNTVSPTYAQEISSDPQFGCGLDGVLRERAADFQGILNGIDVSFWDPAKDPEVHTNYTRKTISLRARCKTDLLKAAGLPTKADAPLLAFIGRLDVQKGVDLLLAALPAFLKQGARFVSLGQGHPDYLKGLKALEKEFPSHVFIKSEFAEPFAHKIYAGADIFLMPSRYEPCGLGQMIAMRYGAVPVVTPTGGLLDTVRSVGVDASPTGFVAEEISAPAFSLALQSALTLYRDKTEWAAVRDRGMSQDFSWARSVRDYVLMYESVAR
jgi:starch synthase